MSSLVDEATELGRLQAEAAELVEWVKAAQLLKSGGRNSWGQLPIHYNLLVIVTWVQNEGRDHKVPIPESIGKVNPLIRYASVQLSQILYWAISGIWLLAENAKPMLGHSLSVECNLRDDCLLYMFCGPAL